MLHASKDLARRLYEYSVHLRLICLTLFSDWTLRLFRFILEQLANLVGSVFFPTKKNVLPPVSNKLLLEPGHRLVEKIKRGELKSELLVSAYIERSKEVQPLLNAIIQDRFQAALEEAREIDRRVEHELSGQEPLIANLSIHSQPLLGLPFTTKDAVSIAGMYLTAGMYQRKGFRSRDDSDVVRLMREAGAIPIALTNVPEAAMWFDATNLIYGRTRNPYDVSRVPGGSSGGEGALIGSAGSLIGIGSDVAGSIRVPSMFCGIFGHKTTPGVIPVGGTYPEVKPEYCTLGPMCRYASDLKPTLKAIVGPNSSKLKLDSTVELSSLKVYVLRSIDNPLVSKVQPRIQDAMNRAIGHLQEVTQSSTIAELHFDQLRNAQLIAMSLWKDVPDTPLLQILTLGQGELNYKWELVKWILRMSKHSIGPLTFAFLEKIAPKKGSEWQMKWSQVGHDLRDELFSVLGDNGVLITPSHPESAPKHNTTWFKQNNFIYTWLWSVFGAPSTHVPLGLDEENLPIGFQVVAAPYNDHLTIAVAEELEKVFGGWIPPSIVTSQ